MASPFYVWDPRTHAGFPASLEQAEYSAIHAPRESDLSPAVESWIEAVKTFTLSDANKPYMSDHVIGDVKAMQPRTVLELEQMHIEGGEYFYKFLVESIQSYGLAAYDSYRGIFICSEYLLPPQVSQQLAQQFAHVVHPAQDVIDIDRLPTSQKQFEAVVRHWLTNQNFGSGKFELRNWEKLYYGVKSKSYLTLIREHDLFIEECGLSLTYRGEPKVNDFFHEIYIKSLTSIAGVDSFRLYPKSIKYNNEATFQYENYLDTVERFKIFLDKDKNYFTIVDPYMKSLTSLNNLINHEKKFKLTQHNFEKRLNPQMLSIAKLVNDPEYDRLYIEEKECACKNLKETSFHRKYDFLNELRPIENI